jgi:short-subunit dehydrogenase
MGQRRQIAGSRMLITGASQGIGRALAAAAALRGAKLVLAARSEEASAEDRLRMLQTAVDRFGGLDILINNAGIGATGHFVDGREETLRKIFEVNFFGVTETIRAAIPILRDGVKPMIVNISSIAAKRGIPARSEYSASKFALQGFTEALRAEMARFDIDVLAVLPGLTATNFSQNMLERRAMVQMDHMRSMSPEEVAEATLHAVEVGKNEIVLTLKGKLLVFVSRFLPKLADRIAAKKVRQVFKDEIDGRRRKRQNTPSGSLVRAAAGA